MELIECLMKTGLTRTESELYIALNREGELTGYEAAKLTGIPRANAYQALSGLVGKGAAYIIEGSVPHYIAVPVKEYCENVVSYMKVITEKIIQDCPQMRIQSEPYITINGYRHISDKIKNMISCANERIYVSLPNEGNDWLREELKKAIDRGLKVVAIAPEEFNMEGIILHRITDPSGQVRLIVDSSQVITGTVSGSDFDICLYSKNKPLVELIKDSLKNEIRLADLEARP